jgi:SNF2 family DNA or RNA helicase
MIKDIDALLQALYNKISLPIGKNFIFNIKAQKLTLKQKKIIKFIELLKDIDYSSSYRKFNERLVDKKHITIPNALLKEFLIIAKNFRVYLGEGFYSRIIETEILAEKLPLPLNLKEIGNMVKLEAPNGVPEALTDNRDVYLYNTVIYLPPDEQIEGIVPFIEAFNHGNAVFFSENEEERVLLELVPKMHKVSEFVELSPNLKNRVIISPVSFKFYFDKEEEVTLNLKLCYGGYEFNCFSDFNEKLIYRDTNKEEEVILLLRKLGFEPVNSFFMYFKDEEQLFNFFKNEIVQLQKYGEVFYSERFTGIKNINKNSFKGHVAKGKYDYFELKFKISDIDEAEGANILRAFRDSKKYYKLENGDFLDLEDIETKKFLKLLDTLESNEELEDNTVVFHKSKGMYLDSYIENEGIAYIDGTEGIETLKTSLDKLKSEEFQIPEDINASLRNYQIEGYNWLKSLDYMGFGGILGDEMGLGKTLQTITFLSSKKGSKSLIVAPTSLIYNWLSEFNRFAPNMKVAVLVGDKRNRKSILKDRASYDVLITTYNLIRRDIEIYKELEFDYLIIDEAQNIKNSNSQNSKAVKQIKAGNRFALTGTPIENSLMELWSIFDFIMPGYLYDEKRFATRYHRRLEEDEVLIKELNLLIKPFILRRYKKDVLSELPDKIEKKLIVPMTKEQIKVYKTYSDYAKDLIEQKVKDNEFKKSKIEILSYITKLRQICLDPSVVMNDYKGGSGKFEALLETVIQGIEEGHKILIFSQFTSILKNIALMLKKNDISFSYLDGSTKVQTRSKLVDDFNNDSTSVFLISLKAGGTGLNLTSADIVIHFDPWWNPAVEDQATDRAHRIGQKNVVEVIKMVAEGSVEEKIISLQDEKRNLISKVVGEDVKLGELMTQLKEEDILSLFSR